MVLLMSLTAALAAGKVDVDTSQPRQTAVEPCAVQSIQNELTVMKHDAGKDGVISHDGVGCNFQALWQPVVPATPPTRKQVRRARKQAKRATRAL